MTTTIPIFAPKGFLVLTLLVLGTACNGSQVKQKPAKAAALTTSTVAAADTSQAYTRKPAHADGTGKVYWGREIAAMMDAAGGGWLERDSRQEEENVAAAIARLPLTPASVVADIGAGTGYYAYRIAPKVPLGKVYAVEVQDKFVSSLLARKEKLGLENLEVVQGGSHSPNLPEASIDLAMMVDVYHELEYPREMLQAIHRALKPGGKLLLLEYRAEDPEIPIKELHKMRADQVHKELGANGFVLDKQEDFLPIQHFLLYRKR